MKRRSSAPALAVGDIVRHRSEFLRNISWCLDVPLNGKIREIGPKGSVVAVDWSDGTTSRILSSNLERV